MQKKIVPFNSLVSYAFMAAGALFALGLDLGGVDSASAWVGLTVSMVGALALMQAQTPVQALVKRRR